MSASGLSTARGIWRRRRERSEGDRAYASYACLLIALIVVLPLGRALWIAASGPSGIAVLTAGDAPAAVSAFVAALWGAALVVGRKRGPALLPPFLLHALTSSGLRRAVTLRGPLFLSATGVVAACAGSAALIGGAVLSGGHAGIGMVLAFVAAAVAAGVVSTVLWLLGQVFPRVALPLALAVWGLAALCLSMPQMLAFTPWGWAGASYPLPGSDPRSVVGLTVLAAASIGVAPALLDRLTGAQLERQAAQWERAAVFSFSLDVRAAASVYEDEPRVGRKLRAVWPSRHLWITFFLRDAVGQARTPTRLLGAVAAMIAAGSAMTLSLLPGAPGTLLAGIAGIVVYGGAGPLAKGLLHAASVAGDSPLYGISDRRLVLLHSLFPLVALIVLLSTSAALVAFASGVPLGAAIFAAVAAGVLALALRLASALKGPLPPTLLTPISSPAGDPSILLQLGWALSDPLIAIAGALTVSLLPVTPVPLGILVVWVAGLILLRWKNRR